MGWLIYFSVSIWSEGNLVCCSSNCIYGLVYLFECGRLIWSELGMLFRRLYIWVGRFILVSASDLKRTWYVVRAIVYMACLVVNPITVTSFRLSSLIAGQWVRLQTLWWFWLKDLSIDEMVGAWCFGCLSGPLGFTYWISFALVFSFINCWALIFALSPCYILIYIFWEMMHW